MKKPLKNRLYIYCVCGARICYIFWHGHETRRVETGKRCKICTQWRMQEEKLHNNNTATMKNPLHSFPPFVYSEYWSTLEHSLVLILAWHWQNKQQLDQCKIPSDGVPICSGTFATILGGITIWNTWSNKSDANLEDSACTVRVLLFFSIPI